MPKESKNVEKIVKGKQYFEKIGYELKYIYDYIITFIKDDTTIYFDTVKKLVYIQSINKFQGIEKLTLSEINAIQTVCKELDF